MDNTTQDVLILSSNSTIISGIVHQERSLISTPPNHRKYVLDANLLYQSSHQEQLRDCYRFLQIKQRQLRIELKIISLLISCDTL
jgi:hypothetical protein